MSGIEAKVKTTYLIGILVIYLFTKFICLLLERHTERKLSLLCTGSCLGWQAEGRNLEYSVCISHVGGTDPSTGAITCCFPDCISRMLESEMESEFEPRHSWCWIWALDIKIPRNILTAILNSHIYFSFHWVKCIFTKKQLGHIVANWFPMQLPRIMKNVWYLYLNTELKIKTGNFSCAYVVFQKRSVKEKNLHDITFSGRLISQFWASGQVYLEASQNLTWRCVPGIPVLWLFTVTLFIPGANCLTLYPSGLILFLFHQCCCCFFILSVKMAWAESAEIVPALLILALLHLLELFWL